MKGLNIRKRDDQKRKRVLVATLVLLSFLFLFFFSERISNSFYRISDPIQKSLSSLGKQSFFITRYLADADQLRQENERLIKERYRLISAIISLKEVERENETLREVLENGLDQEFELVLAEASGFDIFGDSFVIDKGAKDGISIGMPVITSRKVLVGRIVDLYDNFSRVMLVTDKDSPYFDARIQGSDAQGVVKGRGNLSLEIDLISKDYDLREGQGVIAMGEVFPKGLFVGVIKEVFKSDAKPFQRADLIPLFNKRTIDKVFIITGYKE